MSILNRPSDGLFNMAIVLHRAILHEGAMPREKLLALVAPPAVNESQQMARSTLNTWVELGLFAVSDDDVVQLAPDLSWPRRKEDAEAALSSIIRRLVLAPQNNERFWEADDNHSADFSRAVSWMLAQDVSATRFTSHGSTQWVAIEQLRNQDLAVFTNDTRWVGFKSWVHYLGFGLNADVFLIDPTIAVREQLASVFGASNELPVIEFLARLAQELPVVDGGQYRREVESQLKPTHWKQPAPSEVSTSLSRALLRLHFGNSIRLDDRSDAPARVSLLGQFCRVVRTVTHVMKKGVES